MDLQRKLHILADAAKYDASCASSGAKRRGNGQGLGNTDGTGICHSYTPDGRCVSLLKILLTNYCVFDCQYCVNRISSDTPRARFSVEQVVYLTIEFYRRNYIEGLFLSSGIIQSPDYTMEQLVAVARTLRERERFNGYIHLKAVPGADDALLDAAGRYADRLSANVELPTDRDLRDLAPEKTLGEIESAMNRIGAGIAAHKADRSPRKPPFAPAGQSTQMIVGATDATDATILDTADRLYRRQRLRRVYYSAFSPIPHGDARLPGAAPPLLREHRLYQADWLIRFYGFGPAELTEPGDGGESDEPPQPTGQLALDMDPKLAWALRHRAFFPVDINAASREAILRIPGIGARSADRIVQLRRHRRIRMADLKRLGAATRRSRPFLVAADHNPDARAIDRLDLPRRVKPRHRQLELFAAASSALTGEV